MVQRIASLIDETLMAMNAHLHIQMTNEEKAYLDAHFELIHIKKGEHLMNKGDEVCYLYYLETGTIRLSFPDKEKREISARFIEPKKFINFSFSHEEQLSHYNAKALEHCKVWRLPKRDLLQLYDLSINFNKLARLHLERSIDHKIKREEDFHKLDAGERYKKLMEKERWLFRSIPLKDIASYIGITPQALSNIRKRI
jgi:CRP-like cAMP-binding protein